MTVEIMKEEKFNEPTWYFLKSDGVTVTCSKNLKEIEDMYDQIISNPDLLVSSKTILKSAEVFVNLQEK
jgi:hypothetical protein